jgi:hypothetical protein
MLVLRSGSFDVVVIVQTPFMQFGSDVGILNWMLSVFAFEFADSIAARKVQGPNDVPVLLSNMVPQTPSPGFGSLASPVLFTVKVAAVAENAQANVISVTRSAWNLVRLAKEKPLGAVFARNRKAVPILSQDNWHPFMAFKSTEAQPV